MKDLRCVVESLSDAPTIALVAELVKRKGVDATFHDPYDSYVWRNAYETGPAIIMRVID